MRGEIAAPHERLAIGQTLSSCYHVERELGEGGMGVVYLATDRQVPGETFAVKVLKEALHPEALAHLREEVHQTRRLSHPNIVDVHSVKVDARRILDASPCHCCRDCWYASPAARASSQ